ncbi:FkbM family methyltransferase [Pseudomonadales bacterium]|nr:FkbM family methyltransferase [Pseudomonadales bacterium]
MKILPVNQGKNEQRTKEYMAKWDTEATLKSLIKTSSPLIFDVGANNGSSLHDFKRWWPNSVIHCFEPQEECQKSLLDAANQYSKDGLVLINDCAVGNLSNEATTFYTHDINSGISGFNRINIESKDSTNIVGLKDKGADAKENYVSTLNNDREVKVIRLDEYIESIDPNLHIDFMKIDTQGFEPEVLEGLGDKLANVDVILTELMFYDFYERSLSFSDIERFLLPHNFLMFDISHIAKNPMNGRTDWIDVIYINKRIRD